MKSTKSSSDLKAAPITHRLSDIDTDKVGFTISTDEHLPYFWAAYKVGKFKDIDFIFEQELTQRDFQDALDNFVGRNGLTPITFLQT